jgi:ABC-type branched-subunit amino acid transport system ATPase component
MMGIKAGRLSVQVPELAQAFQQLKLIVPERPIEEVLLSQVKSNMWPHLTRKQLHHRAIKHRRARDEAIESLHLDVLRVQYAETLTDPTSTILRIVEFLGISPSPEAIETAKTFVSPELRHFVGSTA